MLVTFVEITAGLVVQVLSSFGFLLGAVLVCQWEAPSTTIHWDRLSRLASTISLCNPCPQYLILHTEAKDTS